MEGLPAGGDLPYFNIECNGEGIIFAIGWLGQWAAQFNRDNANGLDLRVGQELTHFRLMPGEEVRTPLIAMPVLGRRLDPVAEPMAPLDDSP